MGASVSNPSSSGPAAPISQGGGTTLGALGEPATRWPGTLWLVGGLLIVSYLLLTFRWYWTQAQHSIDKPDDWGHAFVVPIISGVILWKNRLALARSSVRPFWPGLLPLLLGVMCYFYFVVSISNHMLQGASIVLCLSGVVLLVFGLEVFRHSFLAIAFLLLGMTISEQVMIKITFQLQMLATQGAWLILKLVSLPGNWFFVEATGNTLEIRYQGRTIPLNVAEACSGMRMVIAFIALAAAVAIFSCKHWWQRFAVVMLSVPVSLFMNILRVVVLSLLSIWNPQLAVGNIHMVIGTILLVPGLFLFLGCVAMLNRVVQDGPNPPLPAPTTTEQTA
jgi:exosortase